MKFHHKVRHHLKHAFIPHKHNDYKPHIFRELSIGIMLASSVSLFAISAGSAVVVEKTEYGTELMQNILVDMANDNRATNNLPFLAHNFVLDSAATMKAKNMATEGYFAHVSPQGIEPWHWFKEAGYTFLFAGENLAVNFTESKAIDDAWMASPTHRANILNSKFKEIGIATYEGFYQNAQTIFVVQMFGTPAVTVKAAPTEDVLVATNQEATTTESLIVTANKEEVKITDKVPFITKTQPIQETQKLANLKSSDKSSSGSSTSPSGIVMGDTASSTKVVEPPKLISMADTQHFSAVKNNEAVVEVPLATSTSIAQKYSTWYERMLFGSPRYVDVVYKIIIAIISVALMIMVFVEVKVRHTKNLIYGFVMFSILIGLVYLNKEIFVHNIVFLQNVL
jgi:uncharacterized protein YkwD